MSKFRGNWSPQVADPKPWAPPIRSRYEKPVKVKANAPPPEPPKGKEEVAFPVASAILNIRDRMREYRSYIDGDGACYDKYGQVIGYINLDDWQVGSPDMEYWGSINSSNMVMDKDDERAGSLDPGRAYVMNAQGSTVLELDNAGYGSGHAGANVCEFEGFTFKNMKLVALYALLVDPGICDDLEG